MDKWTDRETDGQKGTVLIAAILWFICLEINQSINQSIYLQKQAASETTVHRAGRPTEMKSGDRQPSVGSF